MANGLSPRDIDLIFKANTRGATRDVQTLGNGIDDLRSKIKTQTAEAAKGVDVVDGLKASYKELTSALEEVKDNYSLLAKVQSAQSKEDAQANKVEELRKKYAALSAELAATEKPSKTLQSQVDRASTSYQRAQERLATLSTATKDASEAFAKAGGDVDNLFHAQQQMVNQTKELARGITEIESALDGYAAKSKEVAEANKSAAAFNTLAGTSGLPEAQINYIRQQADSYKLLQAAIAEATAQKKTFDAALESQAAKVAAQQEQELAERARGIVSALDAATASEQRLASSRAFAQIAQDSIDAANNQVRFKASLDGSVTSAKSLRDAIRALVDPGADALKSIQGIGTQVDQATDTLNSPKKLRTSQYQEALNSSSEAGAAAGRLAGQIDDYKDQQAAVDAATKAFQRQQAAVLDAAHALQTNGAATQEDVNNLRDLEAGLDKAGNSMKNEEERLLALDAALKKAGVDTKNLATEEQRLTTIAEKAGTTMKGLQEKTGKTGDGGLFGLKPYELQNLGYQVNDVVTGLASGQRPLQVLAQQGGQVAQIFPGFTSALVANAAALSGVAAAALVAYAAYSHLHEGAVAAKDAADILARSGEVAAGTTVPGLTKASVALQDLGVKAEDAKKSMQTLVNEGFNSDQINTFIPLAQGVAEITGEDIPSALGKLGEAFSGGYQQIAKLDDELNFLTADQREHIRALFDQGDSTDALSEAQAALTAKVDAARQPVGELTQLFHNLKGLFDEIVDDTGVGKFFSGLGDDLRSAGVGANFLLYKLRGVNTELAAKAALEGKDPSQVGGSGQPNSIQSTDPNAPGYIPFYTGKPGQTLAQQQPKGPKPTGTTKAGEDYLKDQQRQIALETDIGDLTKRTAQLAAIKAKALQDAADHGVRGADAERLADERVAAEKDKYAKKDAETAKAAQSKAEAAARRQEALQRKIAEEGSSLAKSLGDLTAQAAKGGAQNIDDQLKGAVAGVEEQYNGLIQKAEEFRKLTAGKGQIGGLSIDDYEAALRTQANILEDEKKLAVYEQNVNDLIKARDAELKAIDDRMKSGDIKPGDALKEAQEVTSRYQPLIEGAAKAGNDFAKGIKSGVDAAAVKKATTGFDNVLNGSTGSATQANRQQANDALAAQEQKLNDIVSARNSITDTYNTLVSEGFVRQSDAQAKIAEAYKQTTPLINEQVKAVEALIDAAEKAGAITPQAAEAYRAKLTQTSAETEHLTDLQRNLRTAVDQSITNDAVDTIKKTADALANVAIHGGSVTKVFEAIGEGLVKMLADVLETIATLILEALILSAVDKATGGILKPLLQLTAKVGIKHDGGIAGEGGGRSRNLAVTPAMIAAAPRYHNGTPGVGLGSNEVLAVLEKGEAVIPENSPDHPANKGSGGSGSSSSAPSSIRQVLVVGDDQVAGAMSGSHGEKVVLTHVKRNASTIKQLLNVK